MLARVAARVPSLASRSLAAPRAAGRSEMGQLQSSLRLFVARLKTSLSAGPESMARQAQVEKDGSAPPLPAANMSFWVDSTRDAAKQIPVASGPLADVDVLVLGGGIVGITTAYLLRKQGLKARAQRRRRLIKAGQPGNITASYDRLASLAAQVGLLESGPLCEGVTGHTTAKLTSQHGLCYAPLIKKVRSRFRSLQMLSCSLGIFSAA